MTDTRRPDVVVVGAGISGLATAAELAQHGVSVVVVEKEHGPACEASGRAQGSLRLQGRERAEFHLAKAALEMWREIARVADVEAQFHGNIYIAEDESEVEVLRGIVSESRDLGLRGVELLDPDQTREILPAATGEFLAAMYSPVDGNAQPDKATRYFAALARRAGVEFWYGTKALRVAVRSGRIAGVVTDRGTLDTRHVVATAGVWTPYVAASAGVQIPITPVSMTTGETQPLRPFLPPTIRSRSFSARQRPDGRIVFDAGLRTIVRHGISLYDTRFLRIWAPRLGAYADTVRLYLDVPAILRQLRHGSRVSTRSIRTGDPQGDPDFEELHRALGAMAAIFPQSGGAVSARQWVGVIDMSPDGLPIVDAKGPEGLVVVCGLSGHGFTLGPVIGRICSQLVLTNGSEFDIRPFSLGRFRQGRSPIPKRMM